MNRRCLCCKQFGHFTKDCPKDPNIKTQIHPVDETNRILHMNDNQNNHSFETQVRTVQFLKTCAKIPNIITKNGELVDGIEDE